LARGIARLRAATYRETLVLEASSHHGYHNHDHAPRLGEARTAWLNAINALAKYAYRVAEGAEDDSSVLLYLKSKTERARLQYEAAASRDGYLGASCERTEAMADGARRNAPPWPIK
jgi:hypothetical protein